MNTQNVRCKFILSFTTINCTQIYNKTLKFPKTEHTNTEHTQCRQWPEERRQAWSRGVDADRCGAAAWMQTGVEPRRGAALPERAAAPAESL